MCCSGWEDRDITLSLGGNLDRVTPCKRMRVHVSAGVTPYWLDLVLLSLFTISRMLGINNKTAKN